MAGIEASHVNHIEWLIGTHHLGRIRRAACHRVALRHRSAFGIPVSRALVPPAGLRVSHIPRSVLQVLPPVGPGRRAALMLLRMNSAVAVLVPWLHQIERIAGCE